VAVALGVYRCVGAGREVWNIRCAPRSSSTTRHFLKPRFCAQRFPISQFMVPPSSISRRQKRRSTAARSRATWRKDRARHERDMTDIPLRTAEKIRRRHRRYRWSSAGYPCQLALARRAPPTRGAQVLTEVARRRRTIPISRSGAAYRAAIMGDQRRSCADRRSFSESIKEGFGLTVSEALWKKKPNRRRRGRIRLQILEWGHRILVHSPEGAAQRDSGARQPALARASAQNGYRT